MIGLVNIVTVKVVKMEWRVVEILRWVVLTCNIRNADHQTNTSGCVGITEHVSVAR